MNMMETQSSLSGEVAAIPSTHCRRCGRGLRNPRSVKHGMGPVCWSKTMHSFENRDVVEPCTITDRELAGDVLGDIMALFRAEAKRGHIRGTCLCDRPLNFGSLETYDHEGGYALPGFGKPQWLSLHCGKCNYDMSIWKLGGSVNQIVESVIQKYTPKGRAEPVLA